MPREHSEVTLHKIRPCEPSFAVSEEGAAGHWAECWAPRGGGGEGLLVNGK